MIVSPLSKSFAIHNGIIPPVYADHVLFAEKLNAQYECTEHTSALGLLITGHGNCNCYLNGIKNLVSDAKICFVNRGTKLSINITERSTFPAFLFFSSGFPDLVQYSLACDDKRLLEEPFDQLPYDFSYLERIHSDVSMHQTILSLIELGGSCSSFASLQADSMIRKLFEDLLQKNIGAFKSSENIRAIKPSTRIEIFKRLSLAKEWMEENFHNDITLEAIATIAAMNSQHFLRMFKQAYFITPHQYLIELRLTKARSLLENTDSPISEICRSIGFESIYSFSILFKTRFGMAPSYFRKGE